MQMSTAGRLLAELYHDSECLGDAVATASGIQIDRARSAAIGAMRLTLSEQLRLSEATTLHAPSFTHQAVRLRSQVLSARGADDTAVLLNADHSSTHRWPAPVSSSC